MAATLGVVFFFGEPRPTEGKEHTALSVSLSSYTHTYLTHTPKSNNLACAPQPRIEKSHNLLFPLRTRGT